MTNSKDKFLAVSYFPIGIPAFDTIYSGINFIIKIYG